jgi:2,3-dihydroxyphenylpropionate 1,2-dioxygenase
MLERVRAFGAAVGDWARESGKRVLLVGSGGLSHDPPVPSITESPPEVREFMIAGGALPEDARRAREARIVEQAVSFGRGGSELQQLNPDWDRWLLERFETGALGEIAAQSDADVTRLGGRAGHEIRTWVAAFSALAAAGPYDARTVYYAPVPEWLVAMGVMEASPAAR